MVITDPPFGDNLFYSDLANYFYAWLRLPLVNQFPDLFGATRTPSAQEALAPRLLPEDELV
jgi:adenine-specific DNA methylase